MSTLEPFEGETDAKGHFPKELRDCAMVSEAGNLAVRPLLVELTVGLTPSGQEAMMGRWTRWAKLVLGCCACPTPNASGSKSRVDCAGRVSTR
jgi:hypothetical protein